MAVRLVVALEVAASATAMSSESLALTPVLVTGHAETVVLLYSPQRLHASSVELLARYSNSISSLYLDM